MDLPFYNPVYRTVLITYDTVPSIEEATLIGVIQLHFGGPNKTFAKPETFFELSIASASSLQRGQAYDHS